MSTSVQGSMNLMVDTVQPVCNEKELQLLDLESIKGRIVPIDEAKLDSYTVHYTSWGSVISNLSVKQDFFGPEVYVYCTYQSTEFEVSVHFKTFFVDSGAEYVVLTQIFFPNAQISKTTKLLVF